MADTDSADRDTATVTDAAMLVTTAVAAAMAGVSPRTIRRWIQRGYLPATQSAEGYLVSPADLASARAAAGPGHGHVRGHGHRTAVTDADTATSAPPVVVSAASAQLAAIRDEWLAPLVDRIAELERQAGRLEAERDAAARLVEAERQRADMAERLLVATRRQAEQLQAERDRPQVAQDAPPATRAAPGGADTPDTATGAGDVLGPLRRLWRAIRGE
jgi:hypothetical protein